MALYQKYRPMTFEQVVGQDHITKTLQNLIKDFQSHAFLFYGPQGTGKTSVARILARAVNCTGDVKPCNRCDSCKDFLRGSLDLVELDAASHSGVDMVRETIRDAAHFQPSMATYKVYIIDEVHGLSRQAFDALLKILEEPPRHLIFILATTEFGKVPVTVVSRCQLHNFHRIAPDKVFRLLEEIARKEQLDYDDEGLQAISFYSNGCARDALSLLEQLSVFHVTESRVREVLGLGDERDAIRFVESFGKGPGDMIDILDEMVEKGILFSRFIDQVTMILQSLLRYRLGSLYRTSELVGRFCNTSMLSAKDAVGLIRVLLDAKQDLEYMDPITTVMVHLIPLVGSQQESIPQQEFDPLQDHIVKELLGLGFELVFSTAVGS